MQEETSFFGSKMLKISDDIIINNQNIIYYQNLNNEQINFLLEKNNPPILYNSTSDKLNNHNIVLDKSQTQAQAISNSRWIITINSETILSNYIFATLKNHRTFEGIRNNVTLSNSVNASINDYITKNILNRYQYSSLQFYVKYIPLSSQSSLKYNNVYDESVNLSDNLNTKIQSIFDNTLGTLTITYNQELPSNKFKFNYYFNLHFNRI